LHVKYRLKIAVMSEVKRIAKLIDVTNITNHMAIKKTLSEPPSLYFSLITFMKKTILS